MFGFVLVKPKIPLSFTWKEIQIWWQAIHNSVGLRAVWESKMVTFVASLDSVAFRNAQVTFVTQPSFFERKLEGPHFNYVPSNLDSVFDFSAILLSLIGILIKSLICILKKYIYKKKKNKKTKKVDLWDKMPIITSKNESFWKKKKK